MTPFIPKTIHLSALTLRELTTGRKHPNNGLPAWLAIRALLGPMATQNTNTEGSFAAIQPFLRKHLTDPHWWDGEYDPDAEGKIELPLMTKEEVQEFDTILRISPKTPPIAHVPLGADLFTPLPPTSPLRPHSIKTTDEEWELARHVGGGNASAGFRHLLSLYEQLLRSPQ